MGPDRSAVQADGDGFEVGADIDEPADGLRVNGVVGGSHPDVVVPREPDPRGEAGDRWNRWQRQHGRFVRSEQVRRAGAGPPDQPGVGLRQPLTELGVEVLR